MVQLISTQVTPLSRLQFLIWSVLHFWNIYIKSSRSCLMFFLMYSRIMNFQAIIRFKMPLAYITEGLIFHIFRDSSIRSFFVFSLLSFHPSILCELFGRSMSLCCVSRLDIRVLSSLFTSRSFEISSLRV